MVIGMRNLVKNPWFLPNLVLALGCLSMIASIVASGVDYRAWEASGEPVSMTPDWIVNWHGISLVIILVGIGIFILRAIQNRRARQLSRRES